jgi:uncharacterized repeat protein (TIGR01451 family)
MKSVFVGRNMMRRVLAGMLALMGFVFANPASAGRDVAVFKSAPATVSAGQKLTYNISVDNLGPDAVGSVTLSDALPSNTTFVSARQISGPAATLTTPAVGTNGTVRATLNLEKPPPLDPYNFTVVGNTLFFTASTEATGYELWKSDGTAAGTVLIKDIYSGIVSSYPSFLTDVNGTLFFIADNGTNGFELWKSDGTVAGTVMVKDILLGNVYHYPEYLTNVNGTLFFTAYTEANGEELWKSDGTAAGTVIVKDIRPGAESYPSPSGLTNVNGTLFFTTDNGTNGDELWKSDGTAAGTVLVKDINPGSEGSYPYFLTDVNGTLFFVANNGTNGYELWKSNGTTAGTVLLKDINPISGDSYPFFLTNVNGTLFFRAYTQATGEELWKSDGTAAGTVLIKDIYSGNTSSYPYSLTNVNGTLFFVADNGTTGEELWKSDGTTAGTVLLKDILPGSGSSYPYSLTNVNGILFFVADNPWVSPSDYQASRGTLWKSDGTTAGTVLVKHFPDTGFLPYIDQLIDFNGTLFFTVSDTSIEEYYNEWGEFGGYSLYWYNAELWKSNGTSAGTVPIRSPQTTHKASFEIVVQVAANASGTLSNTARITTNPIDSNTSNNSSTAVTKIVPLLSINDVSIREGNSGTTLLSFTVSLSQPSGEPISVKFATANGTATATSDYTATSGTLTIAAGQSSATISVPIKTDTIAESNDTFYLNLSYPQSDPPPPLLAHERLRSHLPPPGPAPNVIISDSQGIGTIINDDAGPSLSINDATITEGNSGTVNATFTVTLSAASNQTVTVSAITSNGSARSPGDYTATGVRLTFAPGETRKTVSVPVKGDLLDEINETFFVILSSSNNATLSRGRGLGTITDNDAAPTVSIDNISIGEGNSGQRVASLRLRLSAPTGQSVRVSYATANGTATGGTTAGSDYVTVAPTVVAFNAGSTVAYARVLLNGDLLTETNETFLVNLSSPVNATIADNRALGTILNDDTAPALSVNDLSITEGNAGTRNLAFTVTLSKASGQSISVNYATANGTAQAGSDYVAKTGTLTFAPGSALTQTVNIVIKGDAVVENTETLYVLLSGATNASISKARGVGTITNDDTSG